MKKIERLFFLKAPSSMTSCRCRSHNQSPFSPNGPPETVFSHRFLKKILLTPPEEKVVRKKGQRLTWKEKKECLELEEEKVTQKKKRRIYSYRRRRTDIANEEETWTINKVSLSWAWPLLLPPKRAFAERQNFSPSV